MKSFLVWFLALSSLWAAGQSAPPDPRQQVTQQDLRPEMAMDRIRRRNLFHPTRGVQPKGGDASAELANPIPQLIGTLITPKRHSALLRFSEQEDALVVEEGDKIEGFVVKKISQNRVQLMGLKDQDLHWIDLEPSTLTTDHAGGEMSSLFDLGKKIPFPPRSPKSPATAVVAPNPGSRP